MQAKVSVEQMNRFIRMRAVMKEKDENITDVKTAPVKNPKPKLTQKQILIERALAVEIRRYPVVFTANRLSLKADIDFDFMARGFAELDNGTITTGNYDFLVGYITLVQLSEKHITREFLESLRDKETPQVAADPIQTVSEPEAVPAQPQSDSGLFSAMFESIVSPLRLFGLRG